jgi:hypothetical protein
MTNDLVKRLREAERQYVDNEYNLHARAADRIVELEAAMRLIAQNNYGLQGMIEDGTDTPEAKAEYYAGQVSCRQNIARKALEGKDD